MYERDKKKEKILKTISWPPFLVYRCFIINFMYFQAKVQFIIIVIWPLLAI